MFLNIKKMGFTMIELLIVIAVMGILAVAVLAAINPLELINRGKDAGFKQDVGNLTDAVDRFYAGRQYYPWQGSATTGTTGFIWTKLATAATSDGGSGNTGPIAALVTGQEIKTTFRDKIIGAASAQQIYLYRNSTDTGNSTYACFLPLSKATMAEAFGRCKGTLPGDFPSGACPSAGCTAVGVTADTATACMICVP